MIRTTIAAGLAGAAWAFAAPVASANVAIGVACPANSAEATVTLDRFAPGRTISGSLLVTLDGDTVHVGSHRFVGPSSTVTLTLPRGTGRLVGAFAVGAERWAAAVDVACGDGPEPALPPGPPGEPEPSVPVAPGDRPGVTPPPPPGPRIDCAYLRSVGAGRRWLVRLGCVRPQPRITCRELIRRGTGPRWYWRYRCPMPTPPRPPVRHVPVTG